MIFYLGRRLLLTIPLLIGISVMTYGVIFLAPGGPISHITDFNPKMSPEVKQRLIEQYDFDKPFYVQYFKWASKMVRFDFGRSIKDNQPVAKIIGERLFNTMLLATVSLALIFLLAVPIGIFSALKQNSLWDRALTVFVFVGFSVPLPWVALLLMILFGIQLGWLPITGLHSISADEMSFWARQWDTAKHLILPVMVTSLTGLASLSRYMRYGMLEVIRQDYIRTARAKGLPENQVIVSHALRNTLIPLVTMLGLSLPEIVSGSVLFEVIFSYPGLGRLIYDAVMARNIPVIMAAATMGALLTLLGNLIADIAYAYVDPRIRYK